MNQNSIQLENIISEKETKLISQFCDSYHVSETELIHFLSTHFHIDCSSDDDIVSGFERDGSNLPGFARGVCRPISTKECAIIFKSCYLAKIPFTISAGKSNLTGSATPFGGIVVSTIKLTQPNISVDSHTNTVTTPVGIILEDMRKEVLNLSNQTLFYPVNPTSRIDACVGGTLSCNASGFIPGKKGATRDWVNAIEIVFPNGNIAHVKRDNVISKNGFFTLNSTDEIIQLPIPKYKRPTIKNASGPYSSTNEIDFIDLIVGSEGMYGLITSCSLKLMEQPTSFLEFFLQLSSESEAIAFTENLTKLQKGDLSNLFACEYFGYNCQHYMNHREAFFNHKQQVGVYLKIATSLEELDADIEAWADFFENHCHIQSENIIVLNDETIQNRFFEARHSIPENALVKMRSLDTFSIITDAIVPPENFAEFLKETHRMLQNANIEYLLFGHLGDCHLHFHLIPEKSQQTRAHEIYANIIDLSATLGGVYSAEHGTGKHKRNDFIKCYGHNAVDEVKKSKQAIDPHFLLNRGNVFEVDF
jgi:D-lactate dehydrogenase (cytochrome)